MLRVKTGCKDLPIDEVISKASLAAERMTNNEHFLDQQPTWGQMLHAIDELRLLHGQVTMGNFTKTEIRNELFQQLKLNLTRWCDYVNWKAAGNVELLLSSGLPMSVPASKQGKPQAVAKIVASKTCINGQVKVHWSGVKGKLYYIVQTAYEGERDTNGWTSYCLTTDNTIQLQNLEMLKFILIRVCAVNSAGAGPWSNVGRAMLY